MKKTILSIISFLVIIATINTASAKVNATNQATANAIKYYKAGNYTQAYMACDQILQKDPTNALAEYYMAMSYVQLGRKDDALAAYDRVMVLSPNGVLGSYAKRGKKCLETPFACHEPDEETDEENAEDKFIRGAFGSGFSIKARGVHEKEKIEDLKREINRKDEIPPQRFKDYKDFSSQAPSNDEIVAAIRVLQSAGLYDIYGRNSYGSDIASILNNRSENNNDNEMLRLLFGNNGGTSNLSPQVIQSLLTTQMSTNY